MDRKQLAESIKARVNIVDVVGRYVQLTRAGNNHKGLCPFHNEATPSFLVSEDKGIYKCFGCGEGGDAISFVSKMEGISYSEALAQFAVNIGVDQKIIRQLHRNNATNNFTKEFEILKFAQGFYQYYLLNTEEGKRALEYLASRSITNEMIQQFGIGLAPRDGGLLIKALEANGLSFEVAKSIGLLGQRDQGDYYSQFRARIMFQVTNEQGHVIGFSGRIYIKSDDDQAKYINSPESQVFQKSQIIYNLHEARKTARTTAKMYIFEGFLDVIAAHQAGYFEAVATMGTALTLAHAKILNRHCREAVLVFDGDKAGLAATSKAIPILLSSGLKVSVAPMPDGMDPDDYMKQYGSIKFASHVKNAIGALAFMYEYAKQGIQLHTPDGEVEFERRLDEIGKQLGVGEQLKWKFRNEEKKRSNQNHKQSAKGMQFAKGSSASVNVPISSKLVTIPKEITAEKELIYYMLLDRDVFDLVLSQMGTAFNIDVYRKIVQAIEAYYFNNIEMDQEEFLNGLDAQMVRVVREIVLELSNRPQNWSKEMIVDLIDKVQIGAQKLARAGKKEMFYRANHEEQLVMMSELTAGFIH